jgi:hypothetical protein
MTNKFVDRIVCWSIVLIIAVCMFRLFSFSAAVLKHEYSEEKVGFVGFPTPIQHIDTYLASDK